MSDGKLLLQVVWTPDGNVQVSFDPSNEVMTRYAIDKARSVVDAEFNRLATAAALKEVMGARITPATSMPKGGL